MMTRRTIFFVSDQTGVTAETLGHSLLTQFEGHEFDLVTLPFLDTLDKVDDALRLIADRAAEQSVRPIIFSTLVQDHLRERFQPDKGMLIDFFATFLPSLEVQLHSKSTHKAGRAHGLVDSGRYDQRMDATNFALNNDDGARIKDYDRADIILVGVSRSGKTPTCLYLGLTYGVYAANYPLSEDELESGKLPVALQNNLDKLYGLTIESDRLQQIRKERRSTGKYSTVQQVSFEIRAAEAMFAKWKIPFIDTTKSSIEELASTILANTGVERRIRP
ncbi:MAG: kinase/pyrophosphorylase [Gammaproteobacteria bacterium]|nr:kinase/pyrophosphorylase [Gammaproteobacteria bacterium]MCP4277304.1 kinase/pyrophosphorylase [Gammaproteobacteria bacterium]MCP4831635.1 kinase/pyrophosphorylase [Gammaproteobacteria bacterium]MCP4927858.1 kinase/pyrophosphorylase [Gammaproteobacteria bacterium]